jgi:Zn-dependent peptidase ImmA (M78 family)
MAIRRKHIRGLTEGLLKKNGVLASPVPVEAIARREGLRIAFDSLEADISGFLLRRAGTAVVGVNTHHPRVRQRFTIGHELGHHLLFPRGDLHVDHAFDLRLRDQVASRGVQEEEIEANLFAAELLMPAAFVATDLQAVEAIDLLDEAPLRSLAKRYEVSLQALVIRLSNLGYLQTG